MCLYIVHSKEFEDVAGNAWKIILPVNIVRFYTPFVKDFLPYNKWLAAKQANLQNYPSGFHLFENEEDARFALRENSDSFHFGKIKNYCEVVKVEYKSVVARGVTLIKVDDPQCLDGFLPTIVVKQMLVPTPI